MYEELMPFFVLQPLLDGLGDSLRPISTLVYAHVFKSLIIRMNDFFRVYKPVFCTENEPLVVESLGVASGFLEQG